MISLKNKENMRQIKVNFPKLQIDYEMSFLCGKSAILNQKDLNRSDLIAIIHESEQGEWCTNIKLNVIPDQITYLDFIMKLINDIKK